MVAPEEEAKRAEEDRKDAELVRWLRETGFERFSEDVSDLRFAHRVLEAQRWIDAHDFHLASELAMQETHEQRLVAMHTSIFDKAAAYNNIVITIGYAGFFAIWNLTRQELNGWDNIVIALLLGASILSFIAWTLLISLHNATAFKRMGAALIAESEDRQQRIDSINQVEFENGKAALRIQRWWLPVYVFTVGTGFTAGLMLLVLLFVQTLGLSFSFHDLSTWIRELVGSWMIPEAG